MLSKILSLLKPQKIKASELEKLQELSANIEAHAKRLKELEDLKQTLVKEYIELKKSYESLKKELGELYGNVKINIKTGDIID